MSPVQSQSAAEMRILSPEEERLVEEVSAWLSSVNSGECELVRYRFQCLRTLGEAVFLYPSVRETHFLRGVFRNEDKLVESLCAFSSSSHLLHIPTKVVAVRSFLVAKFHAFSLLALLARDNSGFYNILRTIIFSIVCTLVADEVYISCLEDPNFPYNVKLNLADDLIALWDSGLDPRVTRHLPALIDLWTARDAAPPAFGTMDGSSELLRITIDMGKDWREFLVEETADNETKWALEEFLFGLSYEEIQQVRSRLIRFGISAVNADEVRSYLGATPTFAPVRDADPRAIFDFFVDRRDAAWFRKRAVTPGPRLTLEELYLKYRILRDVK
jgi:hypothetical protein